MFCSGSLNYHGLSSTVTLLDIEWQRQPFASVTQQERYSRQVSNSTTDEEGWRRDNKKYLHVIPKENEERRESTKFHWLFCRVRNETVSIFPLSLFGFLFGRLGHPHPTWPTPTCASTVFFFFFFPFFWPWLTTFWRSRSVIEQHRGGGVGV